jgi:hypothetical protein
MGKKSGFRSQDEHPGSYFHELIKKFWDKNSLISDPDPEYFLPWIRD